MKVVKDGKFGNQDIWHVEITCEAKDKQDKAGCGAVLYIGEEDLVLMYWCGTHSRNHYTAVRCPQCRKYNRVQDVPPLVLGHFWTPEREKSAIFDGISE